MKYLIMILSVFILQYTTATTNENQSTNILLDCVFTLPASGVVYKEVPVVMMHGTNSSGVSVTNYYNACAVISYPYGTNSAFSVFVVATNETILMCPWWETGNYNKSVVDRLHADDVARSNRYAAIMLDQGTNSWLLSRQQPKYAGITTNTVHWVRAHTEITPETKSFTFVGWHRYGWIRIFWKEKLTDNKWETVAELSPQKSGVNRFRVYLHPNAKLTKRIINSDNGFFRMSSGGYNVGGTVSAYPTSRIFNLDLTDLFDKPIYPVESFQSMNSIPTTFSISETPPMPPGVIVETYWLNTSSGIRHNSSCRYYEATKEGRACGEDEGDACKSCGG